ncbi:MAG: preprotein translocase subunit SecE [Oscillospiraceae bacterium]|jgi:preprotein translocase subunit SecE|nr:preprotein translocase subunit SecE [Oscillospiraceae bacterium]
MAEEKNEKSEALVQSGSKSPAVSKKRKIKGSNRFAKWFREMRSELKKVVWPTPKQVVNNTIVALTVMACAAVVIWALDLAAGEIFVAIITYIPRLLGGW